MNAYFFSKRFKGILIFAVLMSAIYSGFIHADLSKSDLNPAKLPIVSGRIENDELLIVYNIPKDRHQVILKEYHFMTVDVAPVEGIRFGETQYPNGEKDEEGNTIYYGIVILKKDISVADINAPLPDSITVNAGYQFCTEDGTCLAPESVELKVALRDVNPSLSGILAEKSESVLWSTILLNLLFAFLGGLILNVMPCVLPVLSIKMMGIVKSAHEDREQILKGSMAYTAGVLLSFLIMGAVVAGLKIAGQSVGWGFQFQNIGFVVFLLTLIWVFGLSLFDVFVIQLPGAQTATKVSSRGGHWGSFATGIFAVLLATPCTAPMLGAALGWAFIQPPWMILLSFLIIGLGLAFPFILIGFFPVFMKLIPKPGAWMNTFKEVMAFLLMATVVYLLRVAYFLVDEKVVQIIWFLLMTAFACWILGKYSTPTKSRKVRYIALFLALVIGISAGIIFLNFKKAELSSPVKENEMIIERDPHHSDWYVFNPELLERFQKENRPVFIDFAAEWCLTCKTNESAVLFTQDVQDAFMEKGVQLLRGDYTKKSPLIQEWLGKFNRAGVPLYVFYIPNETDPIVLPEVITKEMIYRQLEKIESNQLITK